MTESQPREGVLSERETTHGSYTNTAAIAQGIKDAMRAHTPGWDKLTLTQRESLEFIATKIGRIIAGNPNEPDHWLDIKGYSSLALEEIAAPAPQWQPVQHDRRVED